MHRRHFTLGLLAATSAAAITGTPAAAQTPGSAGAMGAMDYLAMASRGGMFLEESARAGHEKTSSPAIKRFSRAEVVEQVNLADKLDAQGGSMASAPAGSTPGGVVGGLVAAPFVVAGAAVQAVGTTLGGITMTSDGQKAELVARLRSMPPGPEFDAMFVRAQLMGHQEAMAIHGSYARSGDDPGLRRVAQSALPLIRLHIAQLSRMERQMGATG